MLQSSAGFKTVKEVRDAFPKAKLRLNGIFAHCPFWAHATAWTDSPTVRPFVPADVAGKSPVQIEKWFEGVGRTRRKSGQTTAPSQVRRVT